MSFSNWYNKDLAPIDKYTTIVPDFPQITTHSDGKQFQNWFKTPCGKYYSESRDIAEFFDVCPLKSLEEIKEVFPVHGYASSYIFSLNDKLLQYAYRGTKNWDDVENNIQKYLKKEQEQQKVLDAKKLKTHHSKIRGGVGKQSSALKKRLKSPMIFTHTSGTVVEVPPQKAATDIWSLLEASHPIDRKHLPSLIQGKLKSCKGWKLHPV